MPRIFLTSFPSLPQGREREREKRKEREKERKKERRKEEREEKKKVFVVYSSRQILLLTWEES